MKWYCIKKYKPSDDTWLITRCINVDDCVFYFMAKFYHEDDSWDFFDDENTQGMSITHFCIPEPVEL